MEAPADGGAGLWNAWGKMKHKGDFQNLCSEVTVSGLRERETQKEGRQETYWFVRAMVRDPGAWETSSLWSKSLEECPYRGVRGDVGAVMGEGVGTTGTSKWSLLEGGQRGGKPTAEEVGATEDSRKGHTVEKVKPLTRPLGERKEPRPVLVEGSRAETGGAVLTLQWTGHSP